MPTPASTSSPNASVPKLAKLNSVACSMPERGSRKTQLLEWTVGGRSDWFEASGVGQKRPGMTQPVYGRITSGFGMRMHPLLGYSRFHQGVDFGARHGSPIYAVSEGVVSMAGRHGGHGNFIKLDHGGGMATSYSHLSRYAVSSGQRVAQGQVIGYVGSTGMSTGPHLHFQVYKRGGVVNPRNVTFAQSSLLTGNELASFRSRLKGLLAIPVTGQ
jgi:murein DD-endopeptidase MepM/ murein hydrolase activator NlpD